MARDARDSGPAIVGGVSPASSHARSTDESHPSGVRGRGLVQEHRLVTKRTIEIILAIAAGGLMALAVSDAISSLYVAVPVALLVVLAALDRR